MNKPFLFVGLDYEDPGELVYSAFQLNEIDRDNFGFKINLDSVIKRALLGQGISHYSRDMNNVFNLGRPIFVDLKMWNGKRTMVSVIKDLAEANVVYTNVYALADKPFLEACVKATEGTNTKILGLTILTHYTDDYCQRMFGCSLKEATRRFADVVVSAGCHGIILPGTTLDVVQDLQIEKLVPAVRPDWYGKTGDNYQEQEVSVREAIAGGANLFVCSSPIRKSKDKKEALIRTLDEMI